MHKFKVTNINTGFAVFHKVNLSDEKLAFKIVRAFFSDKYSIEKVI